LNEGVLSIVVEVDEVGGEAKWEASREGSRKEKETRGGESEMEVRDDRVAPWLCSCCFVSAVEALEAS